MQFVALIAAACEMYQTMRLIAGTLTARSAKRERNGRERENFPQCEVGLRQVTLKAGAENARGFHAAYA